MAFCSVLDDDCSACGGVEVELLPALALELAAPAEGDDGAERHEDQRHGDGDREGAGPRGRGRRLDPGGVGHARIVPHRPLPRSRTHSAW